MAGSFCTTKIGQKFSLKHTFSEQIPGEKISDYFSEVYKIYYLHVIEVISS